METTKPKNKKDWNEYLIRKEASFTQSFEWGDLKKKTQKVGRLEVRDNKKIVGVCQFLEEKNFFGEYFYIPYGPVGDSIEVRNKLLKKVAEIGKKEGKTFIKSEPREEISIGEKTEHRIQPKKTLIRDISEKPEKILKSFKENTRYSVRYSKRKGVKIKKGQEKKNLENFFDLLKKTEERQDFSSFSKNYFKNLLESINADLFLALSEEGEVVASTIFSYFGNTATSLHSAFDYEKRKLRATSLIRFEAIKEARRQGCEKFDAWGIDEEKMPGVTKFKKGFGGEEVVYPEGKDTPLKFIKYKTYKAASKIIK